MINKTINFLIQEKDYLCDYLTDMVYPDTYYTYEPLTQKEIDKINTIRKEIHTIYEIIDILNNKGEDK